MTSDTPIQPMDNEDFDALDAILDDLRTRGEDVPQWEFCEGAMAALLCTRRPVEPAEWLPVVLGTGALPTAPQEDGTHFANTAQFDQFMALWARRSAEVSVSLASPVDTLEDERSYHPELMDVRGAVAALPEAERADFKDQELPAYAQVWALGFMFVVENWPEDWEPPRDKETAAWIDEALDHVVALTEDDTGKPEVCMYSEDGAPSTSKARVEAFGEAIWAVYDLRQLWKSMGPRVETLRKAPEPGRNDPCPCGSGKKYKKCHGA